MTTTQGASDHEPASCPVCKSGTLQPFFSSAAIPTLSCALWPDVSAAQSCARGDITLAWCADCGFIENTKFDPDLAEYDAAYENALHFSGVYRDYAKGEAQALIDRYDLRNKQIIDIGCGDGQFLSLLCELGDNTGVGYDPSHVKDDTVTLWPTAKVETRYFTDTDAHGGVDLILSRQVLEHIPGPAAFMAMVRRGLGDQANTVLSFEVPNADYMLEDLSVWDVMIYEHCNQFTELSLQMLFELSGFEVTDLRTGFGNQTLTVDARPRLGEAGPGPNDVQQMVDALGGRVNAFEKEAASRIGRWSAQMQDWKSSGRRVALWGAGARSTCFLNAIDAAEAVNTVVDINPRKTGSYMPGTGHMISAPAALTDYAPEVVVLMNPNYRDEVKSSLNELGVDAELMIA